jgi:hypothetical protein
MIHPIWKDYYVELGKSDEGNVKFRIKQNDKLIYVGKAYARPGEETIRIRINDICADYMAQRMDGESVSMPFVIEKDEDGILDEVVFLYDWSYDENHDVLKDGVAAPVNGHVSPIQWLTYSAYDKTEVEAEVVLKDGTKYPYVLTLAAGGDFNADYNEDFFRSVRETPSETAIFSLASIDNLAAIIVEGKRYDVVDCCKYALYYRNAFGGWDSFLVEGNHAESDELVRHIREKDYNNAVLERGRQNYVNEISKKMTLHTSWLSDEESSRMHHLLNATEVYICDISADRFIPVVMTNTTTEYKTYRGNGGQLVNYAIEVAFANDRIRR